MPVTPGRVLHELMDKPPLMCDGPLQVLIADESSMRCTKCDWTGWPQQDVEPGTGRVLSVEPHVFTWRYWLHGEK